jgi:hypothetical protein
MSSLNRRGARTGPFGSTPYTTEHAVHRKVALAGRRTAAGRGGMGRETINEAINARDAFGRRRRNVGASRRNGVRAVLPCHPGNDGAGNLRR